MSDTADEDRARPNQKARKGALAAAIRAAGLGDLPWVTRSPNGCPELEVAPGDFWHSLPAGWLRDGQPSELSVVYGVPLDGRLSERLREIAAIMTAVADAADSSHAKAAPARVQP